VNKECNHGKNEGTYSQQNCISIVKQVTKRGLRGKEEEKNNNLP
jgi:hypothetical protein